MPYSYSPLRYPGGKSQLANYIVYLLQKNHLEGATYCEAFCGGAGVAMRLLLNNHVNQIILNDLDSAIYSIWYALLNDTDRFIDKMNKTKVSMKEWHKQRNIYQQLKDYRSYNFDLAFAAFFLNRTNRSGIIQGGPIGGYDQKSKFLYYNNENNENIFVKRLSFKDDSSRMRGIRVIPRTTNHGSDESISVKETAINIKNKYNVGGAARVPIPTIYLSLSRLYPLGEKKELVSIKKVNKKNKLYQIGIDEKFKKWYNSVIPNTIGERDELSVIKKRTSVRSSFHMDMKNTPALSQSIGQDNIGNIISALIDIYILSRNESYNGALLCIDEIEVSLHPDTQLRLLDLFDKLAQEYNIQFVLSTHSLTILKEILKKEKRDNENYAVIYLKNPSMPQLMKKRDYELLKADLFDKITYHQPKPKIYFEDEIGKKVFLILIDTLARLLDKSSLHGVGDIVFRNADKVNTFWQKYDKRLANLNSILNIKHRLDMIVTKLGCEELFKIQLADNYFKRVIFMLDGDARIKDNQHKPKVRDYLQRDFNPNELRLSDRNHSKNICFLPGYFAPESYFYRIIMYVINEGVESQLFWRSLDHSEDTALYTPDRIRRKFDVLPEEFTNDDLKKCFGKEIWDFIEKSEILVYYYSDYKHVEELLIFFESLREAYNIALPLTLSNRYA